MGRYGCIKQKEDKRDLVYCGDFERPVNTDVEYDLRNILPPVWDQQTHNSCVSHSTAAAFLVATTKEKEDFAMPSRMFIYYQARKLENTQNQDNGCEIRDAIKTLVSLGVPLEKDWDYSDPHISLEPPTSIYTEAATHRVMTYRSVAQSLNDLCSCFAEGLPVVFGFQVDAYFESDEMSKFGILTLPTNPKIAGGHSVLLCGWNPITKMFLVRNSYGPDWGLGGYYWQSQDYILDSTLSFDFWIIETTN